MPWERKERGIAHGTEKQHQPDPGHPGTDGKKPARLAADLGVSWVSLQAAETGAVGWPRGIMSALEEAGLGNAGDLRVSYDNWREARKKQAKAFFANQKAGGAGA